MNKNHLKEQKGFTLLLAALVASLVLALATSIFGLVQKELILSSISRDSQYAFYAADTGAECALYWDVRYRYFGLDEPSEGIPTPRCGEENICDEVNECIREGGDSQTMSFRFEPNGFCVDVSVTKERSGSGVITSVINADGYSRRCNDIEDFSRVLQRSVELRY